MPVPRPPHPVLLALDFSVASEALIDRLAHLPGPLRITAAHVLPRLPRELKAKVSAQMVAQLGNQVQQLEARIAQTGLEVSSFRSALLEGDVATALVDEGNKSAAELFLLGRHGSGATHLDWTGSTIFRLLRRTRTPVLMVHGKVSGKPVQYAKVLCALEPGAPFAPFKKSLHLLVDPKAQVFLLSVARAPYAARPGVPVTIQREAASKARATALEYLRRSAAQLNGEPWRTRVEVLGGHVAATLVERAKIEQADLLVVGTHGRDGMDRVWMGSTSEAILQRAPCDVMVVPVGPDIKSEGGKNAK